MIKFKKVFFVVLFPVLLLGCGYSPIYKNLKNLDFSISIKSMSGDRNINNLIKSKLQNQTLKEVNKKNYEIIVNSTYEKISIAKNTAGTTTDYKILVKSNFVVTLGEYKEEFRYSESFNIKSKSDKLEQQDEERNVQNSLTKIITRKLILKISQIK